ncbi:hypothetical protein FSARC_4374 [Fusarium sarcochroum]|uniref:Uncharacterized protein n=1 Tax=Fusarium sarcochroum TaxID=1208366 RepID=A0A8H4U2C5_9HYPO|nr:hypothetical protein FSARC_4374 [Fusarium sarcochroum]
MSVDCGFDIFPPLVPTKENKETYREFVNDVVNFFQGPNNNTHNLILGTNPNRPSMFDESFVHFLLPAMPKFPINAKNCDCFLSFSSSASASLIAQRRVQELSNLARHHFGGRVHNWLNQSDIYSRGELREAENKVLDRKSANEADLEEETDSTVTHTESADQQSSARLSDYARIFEQC